MSFPTAKLIYIDPATTKLRTVTISTLIGLDGGDVQQQEQKGKIPSQASSTQAPEYVLPDPALAHEPQATISSSPSKEDQLEEVPISFSSFCSIFLTAHPELVSLNPQPDRATTEMAPAEIREQTKKYADVLYLAFQHLMVSDSTAPAAGPSSGDAAPAPAQALPLNQDPKIRKAAIGLDSNNNESVQFLAITDSPAGKISRQQLYRLRAALKDGADTSSSSSSSDGNSNGSQPARHSPDLWSPAKKLSTLDALMAATLHTEVIKHYSKGVQFGTPAVMAPFMSITNFLGVRMYTTAKFLGEDITTPETDALYKGYLDHMYELVRNQTRRQEVRMMSFASRSHEFTFRRFAPMSVPTGQSRQPSTMFWGFQAPTDDFDSSDSSENSSSSDEDSDDGESDDGESDDDEEDSDSAESESSESSDSSDDGEF